MKRLSVIAFILFIITGLYSQSVGIKKDHPGGFDDIGERATFYGEFKPDNIFGIGVNGNTEPKPSNVFHFEPLDNDVIKYLNVESNLVTVESEGRELPLAIYFSKPPIQLEGPTIEYRVYEVLSDQAVMKEMKIVNAGDFHIFDIATDELGIVHVKLNQHFRNRAVFGGQIYVHLYDNMSSSMINGKWFRDPRFGIAPRSNDGEVDNGAYEFIISEVEIEDIIMRDMGMSAIEIREDKCSGHCILHGFRSFITDIRS